MPRASKLCRPRSFSFTYDGHLINVTYLLQEASPKWYAGLAQVPLRQQNAEELSKILVEWDVLDDEDEPWSTDVESLLELPSNFLRSCLQEISLDVIGGKGQTAPPAVSSNGSSQAATTAPAQTGTPSSRQPGT